MSKPTFESMHTVKVKDIHNIDKILKKANEGNKTYTTVRISYNYNGKEIEQLLHFKSKPSNLIHNAIIWMFFCPMVGKCAYKLYMSSDGYLYHRERFTNAYYLKQTYSKEMREVYVPIWDKTKDKYSNEMQQPYFKKYYNGKATKRYEYLQQKDIVAQQKNMEALKKLSQIFN